MRVIHNGFTNFGFVGKSLRRYLTTTALTATGLMALATPSFADNWTDHTATEGSISVDTATPSTTNITQYTDFVKVQGDGDINAGWTVNVAQPSSSSKYVLYDIENDPTMIMGALNANGEIYIFDENGVIFDRDSQVNVGSIIASTGNISDANIKANKLVFENVGGPNKGEIVNNGSITVAEAGIAAFVAPNVANNGVINAKMGKVVLASGNKVTLDLYGDNLVEIAVNDKLENALVKNSGTINAEGGTVALTAQAAKSAVDNVINMDGVIDVSSVSVKGGKIILGGGNKGVVKVAGALKADGKTGGGSVSVTGQNVDVQDTADISVDAVDNGNGGSVLIYGRDYAILNGRVSGRGGNNGGNGATGEISAGESVGYYGLVDFGASNGAAGSLLIDPKNLTISNSSTSFAALAADILLGGAVNNININAQALANALATTNVKLWATETLSTAAGGIDLSTWSALFGLVKGITTHDLNIAAPTVNINGDITLGTGKLTVNDHPAGESPLGWNLIPAPTNIIVNTLNLNGLIKTKSIVGGPTSLAGDGQINTTANTINVKSPNAKIQQAISFAEGSGETINVAKGTYAESVTVNKSVALKGANAGKAGYDAARGEETIIDPSSPGFHVTADNVTIDGFTITDATGPKGYGVLVENVGNAKISNNIISRTSQQGIYGFDTTKLTISGNKIDDTGSDGIYIDTTDSKTFIANNKIGTAGKISGNGIYLKNLTKGDAHSNTIVGAAQNGILLENTHFMVGGTQVWMGNTIEGSNQNGIRIEGGKINHLYYNTINGAGSDGIYGHNGEEIVAIGNDVYGMKSASAIFIEGGKNNRIVSNKLHNALHGVRFSGVDGEDNDIFGNTIWSTKKDGINVYQGKNLTIEKNTLTKINGNGIFADRVVKLAIINGNSVDGAGGSGIKVFSSNDINIDGNFVDNTDADAIHVSTANNLVKINNNEIGQKEGSVIKGDGIYLAKAQGGFIQGNTISNTRKETLDQGEDDSSGIYVWFTNGVTIGGATEAEGNTITDVDWDGIKIAGSAQNTTAQYNNISNTGRIGIYSEGAGFNKILDNKVFDSNLDKMGNITVLGGTGHAIERNEVWNALASIGDHGILIGKINSGENLIRGNNVHDVRNDGIRAQNVEGALEISDNDISDATNGIFLDSIYDVAVLGNRILNNAIGLFASGESNTDIEVSGNVFTNNVVGAYFQSGIIDLTQVGNTFIAGLQGKTALRFGPGEPPVAEIIIEQEEERFERFAFAKKILSQLVLVNDGNPTYGGTLGTQTFTGYTDAGDLYVELLNGAFFDPGTPTLLNGLNSNYDGIDPSSTGGNITQTQYDTLEARFRHYPDGLLVDENLGLFFFGNPVTVSPTLATIDQSDLFNVFGAFNGDATGLNVRITGLPRLPGQPFIVTGNTTPQGLNNIQTFAGNQELTPDQLNNIETAAGEGSADNGQGNAQNLSQIETEAGGDAADTNCWSDAASAAAGGQTVNVVYGGSMDDSLNQAAACGTSF